MSQKNIDEEILNSVDESRRSFLRKVIVGAAFATPIMASFSMDGFFVKEAEANCGFTSNMPNAANMTTLPGVSNQSFCSNQPPVGIKRCEATLLDGDGVPQGRFTGMFFGDALNYFLKLNRGFVFQAGCITWNECQDFPKNGGIVIIGSDPQPRAKYSLESCPMIADLQKLAGRITNLELTTAICGPTPSSKFMQFRRASEDGRLQVLLLTDKGELSGKIVPDAGY
jgi:hypothetical protein